MKIEEMTLQQKIGQLFVVGFPETEPGDAFFELVDRYKVGNVILFSHNVENKEQLAKLCGKLHEKIRKTTGVPPFISIDEEGGVVSRLPQGCAVMPSAMAQARTENRNLMYQGAKITAHELKESGINFNLAPVLDINSNPENPVIGVRSFGENPETVTQCAKAVMRGYLDGGILCAGKHFPGHGDTSVDSHLSLPVVDLSRGELESRELVPFKALIKEGLPAVTMAHILVPALEPEKIPCTMSRRVVRGFLRENLGFQGLIISDCMEMNAIKEFYGTEAGTVAALAAGVDLIFISHTSSLAKSAILEVMRALEDGRLSMERIDEAVSHVLAQKERLLTLSQGEGEKPDAKARIKFAGEFLEKTITPQNGNISGAFCLGKNPVFVGPVPVTLASSSISDTFDFSHEMQKTFGGEAVCIPQNPDDREIENVLLASRGKSALVLATLNGHLSAGQRKLIEAVKKENIPKAFVALRNPYDLEISGEDYFGVVLYEYSLRTIGELKKYFRKTQIKNTWDEQ